MPLSLEFLSARVTSQSSLPPVLPNPTQFCLSSCHPLLEWLLSSCSLGVENQTSQPWLSSDDPKAPLEGAKKESESPEETWWDQSLDAVTRQLVESEESTQGAQNTDSPCYWLRVCQAQPVPGHDLFSLSFPCLFWYWSSFHLPLPSEGSCDIWEGKKDK